MATAGGNPNKRNPHTPSTRVSAECPSYPPLFHPAQVVGGGAPHYGSFVPAAYEAAHQDGKDRGRLLSNAGVSPQKTNNVFMGVLEQQYKALLYVIDAYTMGHCPRSATCSNGAPTWLGQMSWW